MSKYTAEQVGNAAKTLAARDMPSTAEMLRELERRILQEDEENRRDPVSDPRPGDILWVYGRKSPLVYITDEDDDDDCGDTGPCTSKKWWQEAAENRNATVVRRQEVRTLTERSPVWNPQGHPPRPPPPTPPRPR